MDLTSVINELAIKLNVSVEVLYSVLIKQAFISGIMEIVVFILSLIIFYYTAIFIKSKTTIPKATEEDRYPCAAWDSDDRYLAWGIFTVLFIVFLIRYLMDLDMIVTAFINPEYWILKQFIH